MPQNHESPGGTVGRTKGDRKTNDDNDENCNRNHNIVHKSGVPALVCAELTVRLAAHSETHKLLQLQIN